MHKYLLERYPEAVKDSIKLCGSLFENSCCAKLFHSFSLEDACFSMFSTKLLGYAIIVGASAVKLPQVFKIFAAKSGAGITIFGALLELLAITFNSSYSYRNNFPFSAWGEAIFLAVETALIVFLCLWYNQNKGKALSFLVIYSAVVALLTHPSLISRDILWWLQSSVVVLAVTGKAIQAFKNYKAQHTGQLSAVTAWAILAGSVTRIYTTVQETGDMLTAFAFACSGLANAVIALQVLYYWKSTQRFIEKGKKKKSQ